MLTFDADSHTYKWHGKVVPSVSNIIRPLYAGMFNNIPREVLERKRQLGTALHKASELLDLDMLDRSTVHPAVEPYLRAYERAKAEQQFEWHTIEEQKYHNALGYAGTLDRAGHLRQLCGDAECVVDFKTTAELHPAMGAQLAGYAKLLGKHHVRRFALQLKEDGSYHLKEYTDQDDDAAFVASLALYHWRSKRFRP